MLGNFSSTFTSCSVERFWGTNQVHESNLESQDRIKHINRYSRFWEFQDFLCNIETRFKNSTSQADFFWPKHPFGFAKQYRHRFDLWVNMFAQKSHIMHTGLEYHWNIMEGKYHWKYRDIQSKVPTSQFLAGFFLWIFPAPNLLDFPNSPEPWKPRCSLLFRGTLLVMPDWVVVSSRLPEKPRQWLETLFLCGGKRVDWRIAAYDEISWCFRLSFNWSETYAPQIFRENFHKMDFIGNIHAFDSRIGNPARNKNPGVQRRKSSPRNQKTTKNIHHSLLMWRISSYIQVVSNPNLFSHLSSRSPHVDSVLTLQLKPFRHHPPLLFVPKNPDLPLLQRQHKELSQSARRWFNQQPTTRHSLSSPKQNMIWRIFNGRWIIDVDISNGD